MHQTLFKGKPVKLSGHLPQLHMVAPSFVLVDKDLKERRLEEFHGKKKLIATAPSLDTGTCSIMTKHFNEFGKKHPNEILITISADLPFAQKRFCETESVHNVLTLSMMRNKDFGMHWGLLVEDGPLAGLLARSVFVLDEKNHILFVELVPEITQEPNYHAALKLLGAH